MWLKPNRLLVIVLIVISVPKQFVSSSSRKFGLASQITPIGPKSRRQQLGNQCPALPSLGNPSFASLIEQNCYVDKTAYLEKLIRVGGTFFFLTRPRRFGKTCLVDTMEEFFKLCGSNDLFESTTIYQRLHGGWKRYPTIRLDFSCGIDYRSAAEFDRTLFSALKNEATKMNLQINARNEQDIEAAIRQLIAFSSENIDSPIVILVDEYDTPYTRCHAIDEDEASKILQTLQAFYSTLKDEYKKIHFCFVTGITRLALPDFFSDLNAAVDLTMDSEYAGIVGFNEIELHEYFGNQIKRVASETGKTEEEIVKKMRTWNHGFQFSEKSESLYSPCSVIGYLQTKGELTSSWSETGGSSRALVSKMEEYPAQALRFHLDYLINCKKKDKQPLASATRKELTGGIDFGKRNSKALTALLYHGGYFSIRGYDKASDSFTLNFTNLELAEDYQERLSYALFHQSDEDLIEKIELMIQDLIHYKWEDFCEKLSSCTAAIPNQITTNEHEVKEAWFHFSLVLMLSHSKYLHRVRLAVEDSTNMGRADIVFANYGAVFIFEPMLEDDTENPVFECKEKYVSKYLLASEDKVFCIALKFTMQGSIHSWGVASFSYGGKLVQEDGTITLTNRLSSKERLDILIEEPIDSEADTLFYLSRILAPMKALFANKSNSSPISYGDFVKLVHRCQESRKVFSIASGFTKDITNLLILLDKSYPLIKEKFLKSRIARIRTALIKRKKT